MVLHLVIIYSYFGLFGLCFGFKTYLSPYTHIDVRGNEWRIRRKKEEIERKISLPYFICKL